MCVLSLTLEIGAQSRTFGAEAAKMLSARHVDCTSVERGMIWLGDTGDATLEPYVGVAWPKGWRARHCDLVNRLSEQILTAAADGNVVICGWSPPFVLKGIERVSRVLVRAPLARRAAIVQRQFAYPNEDVALIEIESDDAAAASHVNRAFAADWRDPRHYDLVIDVDGDAPGRTLGLIQNLVTSGRSADSRSANDMIESRIRSLLTREMGHDLPGVRGRS